MGGGETVITRIDYASADAGRQIARRFAQIERETAGWRITTSGGAVLNRRYEVPTIAQAQQLARGWVEFGERPQASAERRTA